MRGSGPKKGAPDLAGAAPIDEQAAEIRHLMEDPGMGLTREEVEMLFDLVDEADAGRGLSMRADGDHDGGAGGGDGGKQKPRHRLGVRLADRGLLLFLQRRGRRRSEWMDSGRQNAG